MTLYHFCAAKHVKKDTARTGVYIHNGWIWLTKDTDPANQSWATGRQAGIIGELEGST